MSCILNCFVLLFYLPVLHEAFLCFSISASRNADFQMNYFDVYLRKNGFKIIVVVVIIIFI